MLDLIVAALERHALLPSDGKVIVAVSGGADSLCLLHILHRLCGPGKRYPGIQLHAAHLNHQLRGAASAEDALAVERLAHAWGLPITLEACDVYALARQEQRSLEEAAREARYRFLRALAQGQPIAVAHHQDDQVETLLLHWLRGGGLPSTVGLQPRQGDIIRPLLSITRAQTLAYCAEHQLTPLEDVSNSDPRFLRNRVRHELLPLLSQLNPGIRETLLRNAEVMQTDLAWIEQQVAQHWPTIVTREEPARIELASAPLRALPLSLQRHLLRHATARLSAGQSPLELRHYRLLEQLLEQETGETRCLDLPQQLRASQRGPILTLSQRPSHHHSTQPASQPASEALLPIPGRVPVPGTSWIATAEFVSDVVLETLRPALQGEDWQSVWRLLPTSAFSVYIDAACLLDESEPLLRARTRQLGDRMRPLGMQHAKKVQDILVDRHIPREAREQLPLFFSPSHCVWLAGIQIDDRARLTRETRRIVHLSVSQADYTHAT